MHSDINAIAAQASTMVSELAAAKGYIAPEHAAAYVLSISYLHAFDDVMQSLSIYLLFAVLSRESRH